MSVQKMEPIGLGSTAVQSGQPPRAVARGGVSLIDGAQRCFDVLGAGALALVFSPIMLALWIIARRDGGPAVFAHERVGRHGERFKCLKFRTMVPDSQARLDALLASSPAARREWAETHKLENDPRVTRVGRFLRKSSLDELPQILNVLRGEMSLVGPRPVTAEEIRRYGHFAEPVLAVRPGITGLWQVGGRNNISYAERIQLEVKYVSNKSFFLDLFILICTVKTVIMKTGK